MDTSEWSERYRDGNTKWDLGQSPENLAAFMAQQPRKSRVLIPGCGRGYEIADLQKMGFKVTAVDYSAGAIEAARATIGAAADVIQCDDFFTCELPSVAFDICYERTFLCALPETCRLRYGERMASLLRDDGLLIGIFHYGVAEDPEPPVPITEAERQQILDPYFSLECDRPCPSGLPVFDGHDERWQVWRKR